MRIRNSSLGYGAVAMSLHWAVAVLVLAAWLTGQFGDELPRGAPREAGLFVHISFGLAIIAFVAVRVIWRLSDPLDDEGAVRIKHRLAVTAHLARHNRAGRPLPL